MSKTANQRLSKYGQTVVKRFDDNGGKLFLVDDSKIFLSAALAMLVKERAGKSVLVITRDSLTAHEYGQVLNEATGRKFTVIDSMDAFYSAIECKKSTKSAEFFEKAKDFTLRHPDLIVSELGTDGKILLHGALCPNISAAGCFNYDSEEVCADLTVSDVVAEARYDFVAVDDVYGLIKLADKRDPSLKSVKIDPLHYEKVLFGGVDYYAESSHSYKKLHKLVGSGSKAVILSDAVFYDNLVNVYAALNLIASDYYTAKDFVKERTADFEDVCNEIYDSILDFKSENSIVSASYSEAKASNQIVPNTVRAMDEFLGIGFDFMSKEEVAIYALHNYAVKYQPNCMSANRLLEELCRTELNMGKCLALIFFADELKGELENNNIDLYGKWTERDFQLMYDVFNKHGGLYLTYPTDFAVGEIRLFSEGSTYEAMCNALCDTLPREDDLTFLDSRNAAEYKCLAVKCLIENYNGITPVTIVVHDQLAATQSAAKLVFGDELNDEHKVTVIDYNELFRVANCPDVKTFVFFELPTDITVFGKALNKVYTMDANTMILNGFADVTSKFYAIWSKVSQLSAVTLHLSEIIADDGYTIVKVRDILQDVYDFSCGLSKLVDGEAVDVTALKDKATTLQRTCPSVDIGSPTSVQMDLEYFEKIAEHVNGIFANSMTVGAQGEQIATGDFDVWANKRKNKIAAYWHGIDWFPIIMFNACSKMMMRSCDTVRNSCNGCEHYRALVKNDFSTFKKSVKKFFDETSNYVEHTRERRSQIEATIRSADADKINTFDALQPLIAPGKFMAMDKLSEIDEADHDGLFSADYGCVRTIRQAVAEIYNKVLSKYLQLIDAVCNSVTEKLEKLADDLNKGCAR